MLSKCNLYRYTAVTMSAIARCGDVDVRTEFWFGELSFAEYAIDRPKQPVSFSFSAWWREASDSAAATQLGDYTWRGLYKRVEFSLDTHEA